MDFYTQAKALSEDFLENAKQYRLGFVEAEMSNPKTKKLGETFVKNTCDGIRMLLEVDKDLQSVYDKTLKSEKFDLFCGDLLDSLKNGGRIIISGCGSTGRLAMRLESSFRMAVKELSEIYENASVLSDSVISLMTGGDYAIIRAVESFEDYIELGAMQAKELNITEKDVLLGVTATGETTSILGSAKKALDDGAKVWMIVCTEPSSILGKLKRADDVYTHKNCNSLYMNIGGMAVTGSTRMQSSTIEQAVIGAALELCLEEMFPSSDKEKITKQTLSDGFGKFIEILCREENVKSMASQLDAEAELYEKNGHVTYFADEYLLDVLADTTERGPTFSVPPFRPQKRKDMTLSLAFVKNPFVDTKSAWTSCFERVPRCIDKTENEYREIGIKDEDIKKIPKINLEALYEFEIGNEKDAEREDGESLATWIGAIDKAPDEFYNITKNYKNASTFILDMEEGDLPKTRMKMFRHLAAKLMINTMSTGTMAKMGRIMGNYMVYINITNKKLIDRATRIVSDLCGVSYEKANYELFYTKLVLEDKKVEGKAAIETIKRLNGGK